MKLECLSQPGGGGGFQKSIAQTAIPAVETEASQTIQQLNPNPTSSLTAAQTGPSNPEPVE